MKQVPAQVVASSAAVVILMPVIFSRCPSGQTSEQLKLYWIARRVNRKISPFHDLGT
jgi:hypothetical protein